MKKIILIAAVCGLAGLGTNAQTNKNSRTKTTKYKTTQNNSRAMSNSERANIPMSAANGKPEEIREMYGTDFTSDGGGSLRMSGGGTYQGYGPLTEQQSMKRDYTHREITTDMLPYTTVEYDTSKNNGHCIGCGSGTLTDPHSWSR